MTLPDTNWLKGFNDLIKEIYGDLAKPGVIQVGNALGTVVGLLNTCLAPIKYLNEKTELNRQNNLRKLAERYKEIPVERIVEVPPEIAVPVSEKLVYVSDENLVNMYIELLAKASTNEHANLAHPSFTNIINNLSPDEAKLIQIFFKNNSIPFLNYIGKNKNKDGFSVLKETNIILPDHINLTSEQNTQAYLSNLEGLGLIKITSDQWLNDDKEYEALLAHFQTIKPVQDQFLEPQNKELEYIKGVIIVTEYGEFFFNCINSKA